MKRILALAAMAGALMGQQQPTGGAVADGLRKGLAAEQSAGRLDEAAAHYALAVRTFDADRKAAASALLRLAAMYQSQGRTAQAQAAQRQFARAFGKSAGAGRAAAQPGAEAAIAAARERVRTVYNDAVTQARFAVAFVDKQRQLGAIDEKDTLGPRRELLRAEMRLAAWEAGADIDDALGDSAAPPANASLADLERVRATVAAEVELARTAVAAARASYEVGRTSQMDTYSAQKELASAQARLAQVQFQIDRATKAAGARKK